ncbi:MAG: hypothetical protein ACE5KX_02680 [Acidimicrobiia bacterium]
MSSSHTVSSFSWRDWPDDNIDSPGQGAVSGLLRLGKEEARVAGKAVERGLPGNLILRWLSEVDAMLRSRRRAWTAALLALWLVVAACGGGQGTGTSTTGTSTTTTGTPTTGTPTTGPSTTGTTAGAGGLGGGLRDELDELVSVAEEVRGLRFVEPPTITGVSDEELARRVREDLEEELDPEELQIDEALYELLGMVSPEFDLRQTYLDLYEEQVAGFYDGDTGELVVPASQEITPLGRSIIIHELVHALTDQHFSFDATFDELVDGDRFDEARALQALVEGDATYFQIVYMQQRLSDAERVQLFSELLEVETDVVDSVPLFLREDFGFPYDSGFRFVEQLLSGGGIASVDRAYQSVPTTSEHILHPRRFSGLEAAREVGLPATPLPGYEVYEESVYGEWGLQLILMEGLDQGEAVQASDGWGGDAYRTLWDGEDVAFVLRYQGDTVRDAEELESALLEYVPGSMAVSAGTQVEDGTEFQRGDYAFVARSGDRITFIAASDPAVGSALREMLGGS